MEKDNTNKRTGSARFGSNNPRNHESKSVRNFYHRKDKKHSDKKSDSQTVNSPHKLNLNKEGVYLVPLGGCREFGMNCNLYYCRGKWIMIDLGIGFETEEVGGVSVLMPNVDFIRNIPREDFLGFIITHGHEDHLGGVQYLKKYIESAHRAQHPANPEWKIPVYSSQFTISLLNKKLEDMGSKEECLLYSVKPKEVIEIGPFKIHWIGVTHSIPDNAMVGVTAKINDAGREVTIIHTGDWRFDPNPVLGEKSDLTMLAEFQKEDVIAVVGDSTQAMVDGPFKTETDVKDSIEAIISKIKKGRVVVVCFSTNLSRVDTCARIGQKVGRKVALVGRSLHRIEKVALENGYLEGIDTFLTEDEAAMHKRDELLIVCVGSQGEPKSGLRRLAEQSHPKVKVEKGDTIIISARTITGKEKDINEMMNKFAEMGVNVITTHHDADIHVSGHPPRDDLMTLYKLVQPKAIVPVHGEMVHLIAHMELANSMGIKAMTPKNGQVIFLGPTKNPNVTNTPRGTQAKTVALEDILTVDGEVKVGKLALDGKTIVDAQGLIVKQRMTLKYGCIVVSVLVKPDHHWETEICLYGICEEYEENLRREIAMIVETAIHKVPPESRKSYQLLNAAIRHAVRSCMFLRRSTDPVVIVLAHIPRGTVIINAKQNDQNKWSLKLESKTSNCNPKAIETIEKSLSLIASKVTARHRDRAMSDIRYEVEKCLNAFEPHLKPYIMVQFEHRHDER